MLIKQSLTNSKSSVILIKTKFGASSKDSSSTLDTHSKIQLSEKGYEELLLNETEEKR